MAPFFQTDSINTYYEDHGNIESYPIVLVHPIGGNILIWQHEIELLVKSGFRVIAYELRGHNRTDMGRVKAYAMRDLVDDLTRLLEYLQIKKCTLIGHSIGGAISSQFAAKYPECVDAIIMINSSPKKFLDKDLEKHFRTRQIAITQGMEALVEHKMGSPELRDLFQHKKYSDFFRQVFTKTSVDGFVAATIALYTIPEDGLERLKASGCKVFAIVGSEDDVFMRLLKETKEAMPEMNLTVLQGCDHWVVIEKPDEMYDVLMEYLDKIKSNPVKTTTSSPKP
ncbi:MAG TPA: alpha/beta hydrolase [Nitrososphaera sp.]|nr:alpha/beta hydrolase [Nitrososphaera sp.]